MLNSAVQLFPLVLLQAKVVGASVYHNQCVSSAHVSISSPSSEGGGLEQHLKKEISITRWFPLVLLQAKVVG